MLFLHLDAKETRTRAATTLAKNFLTELNELESSEDEGESIPTRLSEVPKQVLCDQIAESLLGDLLDDDYGQ